MLKLIVSKISMYIVKNTNAQIREFNRFWERIVKKQNF